MKTILTRFVLLLALPAWADPLRITGGTASFRESDGGILDVTGANFSIQVIDDPWFVQPEDARFCTPLCLTHTIPVPPLGPGDYCCGPGITLAGIQYNANVDAAFLYDHWATNVRSLSTIPGIAPACQKATTHCPFT